MPRSLVFASLRPLLRTRLVNSTSTKLQPYPFEKLRQLFAGVTPNPAYAPISLGIGEPKHPTPAFIQQALADNLDGLANYPTHGRHRRLRAAIAGWLERRYGLPTLDPATQVLPVNGSREALFALAQTVIDPAAAMRWWSARIRSTRSTKARPSSPAPSRISSIPIRRAISRPTTAACRTDVWARVQLLYVCSPGNPTGAVLPLDDWQRAVRAVRPPRLRDRRRRVLFRDLFHATSRRWAGWRRRTSWAQRLRIA